jgi:uncharacterized protein involved in exopolysaccharide biosynthesis
MQNIEQSPTSTMEKEKGFLDYISVLYVWRRFIIINVVVTSLIAVGVSFLLPKWYKSTASILPPKDAGLLSLFGGTSSVLKGLSSLSRLGGAQNSGSYNFFAILNSRMVMDSVINKFNLVKVYNYEENEAPREKTLKELRGNVSFEFGDDDDITIEVYDTDRMRAANIANYFIELLNTKSIELGTQEARSNREFLEQRLQRVKDSLHNAEEMLKSFQEESGTMISPEQASSVSGVAELYAQKAKKEIEVAVLEQRVSSDNELLKQLRIELNEIEKKLSTFPQIGISTLRMYRDVITQQKILEFLLPIFEQAKINEQKDIPVLLVLDKAIPAERKSKPQRALIVFITWSLSLFISVMFVFLLNGSALKRDDMNSMEKKIHSFSKSILNLYRIPLF